MGGGFLRSLTVAKQWSPKGSRYILTDRVVQLGGPVEVQSEGPWRDSFV